MAYMHYCVPTLSVTLLQKYREQKVEGDVAAGEVAEATIKRVLGLEGDEVDLCPSILPLIYTAPLLCNNLSSVPLYTAAPSAPPLPLSLYCSMHPLYSASLLHAPTPLTRPCMPPVPAPSPVCLTPSLTSHASLPILTPHPV